MAPEDAELLLFDSIGQNPEVIHGLLQPRLETVAAIEICHQKFRGNEREGRYFPYPDSRIVKVLVRTASDGEAGTITI